MKNTSLYNNAVIILELRESINFHKAYFDYIMATKLIFKIYQKVESEPKLYKDYLNKKQENMETHYYIPSLFYFYNFNNFYY